MLGCQMLMIFNILHDMLKAVVFMIELLTPTQNTLEGFSSFIHLKKFKLTQHLVC